MTALLYSHRSLCTPHLCQTDRRIADVFAVAAWTKHCYSIQCSWKLTFGPSLIFGISIVVFYVANNARRCTCRKAVRATLILIPLLGLQYILFPIKPPKDSPLEATYLFLVASVTSLQVNNAVQVCERSEEWGLCGRTKLIGSKYKQHHTSACLGFQTKMINNEVVNSRQ